MTSYSLSRLSNWALDRGLCTLIAKDRETTALLLAHIAEFRARKLYAPAGFSSMHAYCVGKLHFAEDAAHKRLQAAGIARRFPIVFESIAAGRLQVSGLCLLAPYLTEANAYELLASAERMSKSEIEVLIARRFPRSEELPMIEAIPSSERPLTSEVKPIATQRFSLHLTMSQATRDKLIHAQDLLGCQISAGDMEAVFDRALDVLIARLEKWKESFVQRKRTAAKLSTEEAASGIAG